MKPEHANSAASTGTTSTSGPASSGNKPQPPAITESDYLTRQAEDAKAAIAAAVGQLKTSLTGTVDPQLWAREHPWVALGIAAAGGFAAATMLTPSKEEQALKKLEQLEDALLPERRQMREKLKAEADAKTKGKEAPSKPGIGATIVREILGVIKPAIMSAVAAGVSSKVAQPDGQQQQQGGDDRTHGMAVGTAVGTAASPPGEDVQV
jgi:hypothetical protein